MQSAEMLAVFKKYVYLSKQGKYTEAVTYRWNCCGTIKGGIWWDSSV
jgi:hypothetical protein